MSSKTEKVVSRDPEVVSGELVFAGTRVPAKNLVDYLKAGDTLDVFSTTSRASPVSRSSRTWR